MDPQTLDKAKALKAAADQAQSSLSKMEEKRGQVKASVFQKVRAEYETKLAAARRELDAVLPRLETRAHELVRLTDDAVRRRDECAEQEDEVTLRHHIGEIADDDFARRIAELHKKRDAAAADLSRDQAELGSIVGAFKDEAPFAALASRAPSGSSPNETLRPAPAVAPAPAAPPAAPRPAAPSGATPAPSRAQIESTLGDPFADVAAAAPDGKKSFYTSPMLLVKSRGEEDSYILDLGEFGIGRGADNDIVIDEDTALPKHAVVRFERDHYVVMSFAGDGALTVNGKATKKAPLQDGDVVRIGKSEITFRNVRWEE